MLPDIRGAENKSREYITFIFQFRRFLNDFYLFFCKTARVKSKHLFQDESVSIKIWYKILIYFFAKLLV